MERKRSNRDEAGRQERIRKAQERRQRNAAVQEDVEEDGMRHPSDVRVKHKQGRKKGGSIVSTVLIVICAIVFCVSGFQLLSIFREYKAGTDSYEEVIELAIVAPETIISEEGEEVGPTYEYYYVDFDALLAENSDTVGWIRFDAPEIISYPLVQTDDNSTYLTTTFQGTTNSSGAVFLDMANSSNFTDDNTIIYGHNMKNGSMFGSLDEYNDGSFYEEYPYFYIYTPDGKASKYQVVAAEVIEATDSARYMKNFSSASEYQSYIDEMLKTSYYDTGTEITTSSNMVTLSTCTGSDTTRFIVQGVKVEEKDMVEPEE